MLLVQSERHESIASLDQDRRRLRNYSDHRPIMKRIASIRDSRLWIGTLVHTGHSNHSPVAVTMAIPWQSLVPAEGDDDLVDIVHTLHYVNSICELVTTDLKRHEG